MSRKFTLVVKKRTVSYENWREFKAFCRQIRGQKIYVFGEKEKWF
jgi:hypothetical protein